MPPICEQCLTPMRPALGGGAGGMPGVAAPEVWVCRGCGTDTVLLLDADGNDMGGIAFARRHVVIEPTDAPAVIDDESPAAFPPSRP